MVSSHVYIIHGYTASPRDHWFSWLKRQLTEQGVETEILALPNSSNPRASEWDEYLDANIRSRGADTFFVAHSLGCVTLLRYLSRWEEEFGGVILVSGFCELLPELPELDEFVRFDWQPEKVRERVPRRALVASRNDTVVPWSYTEKLSGQLHAPLHTLERAGHFLGSEGYTELPLVYDLLREMLQD